MSKKGIISYLFIGSALLAFLALTPSVFADMCTTQYGGETTCRPSDLTVNKEVRNGATGNFVENLSATDSTFSPGSDVLYRLIIKNTSGETFNPVYVKDVLPTYLTFVAGPGTFNGDTNTLTFELKEVYAGETRTVDIMARVKNVSDFGGKSFVCVTNYAEVKALNRFDSDTAQVCLNTGNVLGATTLPVAGYNDYLLLLPFAGVGLAGLALLKKPASTAKRGEKS
jgi:uncharacterized repeat protein (TIGR01451 family)